MLLFYIHTSENALKLHWNACITICVKRNSVAVNGKPLDWFEVLDGVRQECLTIRLFNLYLDIIIKKNQDFDSGVNRGENVPSQHPLCRWHYTPSGIWQPVNPTNKLEGACSMWGIKWYILNKVPVEKSQQIRLTLWKISKAKQDWLPGQLGGWKCRLGPPWCHKILESQDIHQLLIFPIAIYGSESWTLREVEPHKLGVFKMSFPMSILGVTIMDKVKECPYQTEA